MAKTKFKKDKTSAKIKELKGEKPENITEDELTDMQSVVNRINNSHMELGQLEARKHGMLHYLAGVQDEMTLLQNKFDAKYKTNNIDIKTGKITYEKENGEANKKD
tara:strand:- start:54 stop:371 length:318 start_codon:yes stop_codon:yes gene_type:complete